MDPDIRRELDEVKALVTDNHRMLRAMRRDAWFGFVGKLITWALIIVIPAYLYVQYLGPLMKSMESLVPHTGTSTPSGPFGLPSSAQLKDLINSVKAGK